MDMPREVDVVVVGSGPAGTQCAKKIAEAGYEVEIYERRTEIGAPKRCGEGLDESAENLIGRIPERCIAQKIRGARLYAPNGKYIEIPGKGYILERKVFDKWLSTQAVKAGAHITCGTLINELIVEGNVVKGVRGNFDGTPFETRAKVVIAATGAESPLSKQAGINTTVNLKLIDTCYQYEMSGVKSHPQFIHIWMGNEIAPRGYVWVFPKGNETANVGVGVIPHEKNPKWYLDRFVESCPEVKEASIIEVNCGGVPVGGLLQNMVADGFVVCGEAAHHVNPIHGGGIKEAIISGQIAAECVIESLKKGDVSKESLGAFNERWWKERGEHVRKVEKAREAIENMTDDDFNMLVDILKPDEIIELTQGKIQAFAKIVARHPQLLKFVKYLM
jgi:digeranylgeranylglycerophospholipid reductase